MNGGLTDLEISITDDRMAIVLDCLVNEENLDSILTRIQHEFKERKIVDAPKSEALRELILKAKEEAKEEGEEEGWTCVRLGLGREPVPPQNGVIEWAQDFFNTDFVVDEKTGTVDYRHRVAHMSINEGDLLARVTISVAGQDGCDVFGKRIRVEKVKRAKVRVGANVRAEERPDGLYLYAAATGRINWKNETLAVDKVLRVSGSVGFETGDIDFPGCLFIEGDVLAGSQVKAEGDVEIKGYVEAANVEAGGNLMIHGGVSSAEGKRIIVGGNLHAKFIQNAYIEAGQDIIVEREIIHSTLKTRGSIVMPSGRLVGGEATALKNITVGQAGSVSPTMTCLTGADDFHLMAELDQRNKRIASLEKEMKKIKQDIEPLLSRKNYLTDSQQENLTQMFNQMTESKAMIEELRMEIEQISGASLTVKSEILIKDKLFPETFFKIKGARLRVLEAQVGPIRVVAMDGQIKFFPNN